MILGMGASGWEYRIPYAGSVEATFAELQRQVLANGEYLWPNEDLDLSEYPDLVDMVRPRPASLEDLVAAKENEEFEFWDTGGTHSILDLDRVSAGGSEFSAIAPLDLGELMRVFVTAQPGVAELERARTASDDPLNELLGQKWSGRCVTLFADGEPVEVFFWGWSGD